MKFRSIAIIWMAIAVALSHFATFGNQAVGWQVADDKTPVESHFKIYALKYVEAEHAKQVIGHTIGGMERPATITADDRANTLIVVAGHEMQEMIRDLILQTDVEMNEPVEAKLPREFRTIALGGLNPHSILKAVDTFRRHVGVEVVEDMGIVVLTGEKDDVDRVQDVIKQIIESAPTASKESSVYVAITFIVEATQIDEKEIAEFGPPNPQIKSVIAKSVEAGLISIDNPVVVSKTVNRVRVNQELPINVQKQSGVAPAFVNGSESGGRGYALRNSGYISQLSGKMFQVQAELVLTVNSKPGDNLQGATELTTNIEVPLDHPVLMSFSTILGVDSAVIIQVHGADEN